MKIPSRLILLACTMISLVASGAAVPRAVAHAAPTMATLTVTGVAANNSSAKIDFNPVAGAADYRVYDVSNPTLVKYAGITHLDAGYGYHFVMQSDGVTPVFPYTSTSNYRSSGPQTLTVPSTEIQWNLLDDGLPHTLVVQAVNQLGPVPPGNLTDYNNNPLYPPAYMSGANEGPTPDGNMSINGQGAYTDTPQVIAQSAPFTVQANKSIRALPSSSDAVQTFYDTFDSSENNALARVGPVDARTGVMTYTLNAGTSKAWNVLYQGADTDHSKPMVMDGHFMDTTFDGQTPSSIPAGWCQKYNLCPHNQYTNMSLTPQTTADLSGGKLLHMTMEVDSHIADSHRWLAWQLAPATDPITNFRDDDYVISGYKSSANTRPTNRTDLAMWLQLLPSNCDAMLFEGPKSPTNPAPIYNQFISAQTYGSNGYPICQRAIHWGDEGAALDDRDRWDVFMTTTHLALFEDGQLVIQSDIPDGGLPFTQAKLYFTHYVYATAAGAEGAYLRTHAPWETFWLNDMQYSDERHWDNMGFEVLPASDVPSNWATLASRIQMPAFVPPSNR